MTEHQPTPEPTPTIHDYIAAMPAGINAYLFAHMYGVGKRVAATSVLICTAASILTVWAWLQILP